MIVVLPALMAVTTPAELTLATEVLLLIQPPPVVASVKVDVEPIQILETPVMAVTVGTAITLIAFVVTTVPQAVVTE